MIRVHAATVEGRIAAPGSKSHTHRAYILGALSGNGLVRHGLESDDTKATLHGLEGLGFLSTREADGVRIGGVLRGAKKPLQAHESGTTLRLLTCVASLASTPVTLEADASLRQRPIEPLLEALRALGVRAEAEAGRVTVQGPLQGGACEMPGDVSSQFVSGLLLAAPLAPRDVHLRLTSPLVSRPYVDLTLAQLRHHAVRVEASADEFHIPGQQRLRQKPYDVPGDYSSAAFLLAAAAVTGGRVTVDRLGDDLQGDRKILEHLRAFGCAVSRQGSAVEVRGGPLDAAEIDLADTPDLFPVVCVLAARARGTSRFVGAHHLRSKESDRIHAMAVNLARFGIHCEERPDGLVVHGGNPRGAEIQSFGDHRIGMALLVLGLAAEGATSLPDPEVVNKSYPGFLDDLARVAPEVQAA